MTAAHKSRQNRRNRPLPPAQENAPVVDKGLLPEIKMLRTLMQRINDLVQADRPVSDLLPLLDTMSMACSRLAALLKTQMQIEGSADDLGGALNQALARVLEDLRKE